ncbi:hypothetical protein ASF88_16470 [Leifsonia sp. Leaf336]|uniref:DUF7882 family protein n=1 Tax=Leifsonia sp. Leaf336 TaxID=1736341 RepID=UPI0006F7ABA0|nr:hypothetical protein [Leifsonia sp. Leaf336]KQR50824.1 hypothetical protein ASF88_16470 [Leifsonia sp. Leaf336]
MGTLIYGGTSEIDIEDRTLAHMQLAIITKLRRNEQFLLSWDHGVDNGSGYSSIWIHPAIPLYFRFAGGRRPSLNREWVEALLTSANSVGGLHIIPEPVP